MGLRQRLSIERCPINWAQWVAKTYHYMHQKVHPRAHPFAYQVSFDGESIRPDGHPCGMVMFATVHFTRQKELFGYDEIILTNCTRSLSGKIDPKHLEGITEQLKYLIDSQDNWALSHKPGLDKWQVLVLSRMWLHDDLPRNSATCVMGKIWKRIQWDWLNHHPPVDNQKPYNIRLVISWCNVDAGFDGAVYKAANFKEIKTTKTQRRHSNTRGSGGNNETLVQYALWLKEPRLKLEQPKLFQLQGN